MAKKQTPRTSVGDLVELIKTQQRMIDNLEQRVQALEAAKRETRNDAWPDQRLYP